MPSHVDKDIQIPIGQQPSRTQTPQPTRTEEPLIGQVLGTVADGVEKVVETGVRGALVVLSAITGRPDIHPDRLLDDK
jgi:hypothetical protein